MMLCIVKYYTVTSACTALHCTGVRRIQDHPFKVLHGIAPEYLGPVVRVDDLSGRRSLHSDGINRLQ